MKKLNSALLFCFLCITLKNNHVHSQDYDKSFYLIAPHLVSKIDTDEKKFLDSCLYAYHHTKNDTLRVKSLAHYIAKTESDDLWPRYNLILLKDLRESMQRSQSPETMLSLLHLFIVALNDQGFYCDLIGNLPKALRFYEMSLNVATRLNHPSGMATAYNNIGYIHSNQGDISLAISYYEKSLAIYEEMNDDSGRITSLLNLGSMHSDRTHSEITFSYYNRALELAEKIDDKQSLAAIYNNLGISYRENEVNFSTHTPDSVRISNIQQAHHYFRKSLDTYKEIQDEQGISNLSANLGLLYLTFYTELGFKQSEAIQLSKNLSVTGLRIAKALNYPDQINRNAGVLYKVARLQNDYSIALEMRNLEIETEQILKNNEILEARTKQHAKYEFDKQWALQQLEHDNEIALSNAREENQRLFFRFAFGAAIALILFLLLLFNRLMITRKQKNIIEIQKLEVERQKQLVEQTHQEIKDSINYAERIQRSFLATTQQLDEHLKDYFIYFNPKEAVSGDFYWASPLTHGSFALCCADSTGHGVPGAIMSILNITSLEKAIESESSPEKILFKTREIIIDRLKNDGSSDGGKDGMDCSLLVFNHEKTQLIFASAHNPIFILRNSELLEFKGDKMPVGKHDKDNEPYTLHAIDLQQGDLVYTLTDGYQDQFGGNKGKKFMVKRLKELLLEIAELPMSEQHEQLTQTFNAWKGAAEQVDDVCIIGVKIT